MKIGDRVEWTSQSASFRTTKRGEIVAVVPAETPPERCVPDGYRCGSPAGFGMSRDHESYLVKVDGKGRGLYWPRVKHLSMSNPGVLLPPQSGGKEEPVVQIPNKEET